MRLETFESEFHEQKVREVLDGVFSNSAFTIFDIDGKTQLTGSGRMPLEGLTGRKKGTMETAIGHLNDIAADYPRKGDPAESTLQDFHTFRQALNVASADQRLLLFVVGSPQEIEATKPMLQPLMADPKVVGKFHLDLCNEATDRFWAEVIEGSKNESGFYLIHSGKFGIRGVALAHLPLDTTQEALQYALLQNNQSFARTEQRKAYAAHVVDGMKQGVFFEQVIPFGEDRDGDGLKDNPKVAREAERRRETATLLSQPAH
ncbi:MAG: hypothetical protein AAGA96_07055 [Verrucomicrobiota bacterium]